MSNDWDNLQEDLGFNTNEPPYIRTGAGQPTEVVQYLGKETVAAEHYDKYPTPNGKMVVYKFKSPFTGLERTLRSGSVGVIIEECIRFRNGNIIIHSEIVWTWLPIAMRRFMLHHHHKRLVSIAFGLQPIESEIGYDIGCVTGILVFTFGCFHWWIVIRPLSIKNFPKIESSGITFQMPFADHCRLISNLLKQFGKGLL